jgi:ATP-dependent Zn protease
VVQTAYIPEKERYHVTKSQLLAMMDTMMGGRAAEELVFGPDKITSGASNDLKVKFLTYYKIYFDTNLAYSRQLLSLI